MRAGLFWARAEFRERWRGLAAVALLIGLLGAVTLTALAGARRTSSAYDRLRASTRGHDVLATAGVAERARLVQLGRLPQVVAFSVGDIYQAYVDLNAQFDLSILAGGDGRLGHALDAGRMLTGRLPRPDRSDEVALNPRAASALQTGVGRTLDLGTLTPDQLAHIEEQFSGRLEGPPLHLRVTGVVRNPDDLQGDRASLLLFATPAFGRRYEATVSRFAAFGAYRLRGGQSDVAAFFATARPLLGTTGPVSLTGADDVGQGIHDSLRVIGVGLLVLGVVALIVCVLAGGQALGRQLWLSGPDQPALAALGLTRRQRTAAVGALSAPVALGAAGVALAGALLASPLTPISLGRQAEPHPGIAFDPLVHPLGALVVGFLALGCGLAVGWLVTDTSGSLVRPRTRRGLAASLTMALHLGPSGSAGARLALERGTGRTALPVRSALAAAVAAAVGLVASFAFAGSLDRLAATPARYGAPWDLQPELSAETVGPAAAMSETASLGVLHSTTVKIGGREATAYAMEPLKGPAHLSVIAGRAPATADEVALGRDQLRRLDRRPGDTVTLATEAGARQFRIVGTFVSPGTDQDPIAGGVMLSPAALDDVKRSDVTDQAVVTWRSGVDPRAGERHLRRIFAGAISAYSYPRQPGEVANLARVGSLPRVLGLLMALVGVVAVGHTLTTSARRRRKDVAVLRALGFVRRQVIGAVAAQATIIVIVGLVLGIPLGVAAGRWVWILVASATGVATDPLVPMLAAVVLIPAGALVVANVLALPFGAAASRSNPSASLRTE